MSSKPEAVAVRTLYAVFWSTIPDLITWYADYSHAVQHTSASPQGYTIVAFRGEVIHGAGVSPDLGGSDEQ